MSGKDNEVLKVVDIFRTIQGEATFAGFPSLFIRLNGCNLNCAYCDTPLDEDDFDEMTLQEIVEEVSKSCLFHVCITGGEPLIYKPTTDLCYILRNKGYSVSVETNGTIPLIDYKERGNSVIEFGSFNYSMDFKLPSAGEREYELAKKCFMPNFLKLGKGDCLKFVIGSLQDIEAMGQVFVEIKKVWNERFLQTNKPDIFISPIMFGTGKINSNLLNQLVDAVIEFEGETGISVRLQVQLHKIFNIA